MADSLPRSACSESHYLQAALPRRSDSSSGVDRRLAIKNLRTGLIAGAISLVVFALAWVVGLVY